MVPRADIENGIELLKRTLLGLWQEEPSEYETKQVPRAVPGKSALRGERCDESGPGQGQDEVEAPASRGCKSHACVAHGEWE